MTLKTSRRAILARLAAAPVAGFPGLASALPGADPIFAAIEEHRRARVALHAACDLTDEVLAEEQRRMITENDETTYALADKVESYALRRLSETQPATLAGLAAALVYLVDYAPEDNSLVRFAQTAATSPLLTPASA